LVASRVRRPALGEWDHVAQRSAKMLSFLCASWKRLRIFEGIVGVFQDAHFRKRVRIFEWSAHLRRTESRAT
jgi:hypothetical protein